MYLNDVLFPWSSLFFSFQWCHTTWVQEITYFSPLISLIWEWNLLHLSWWYLAHDVVVVVSVTFMWKMTISTSEYHKRQLCVLCHGVSTIQDLWQRLFIWKDIWKRERERTLFWVNTKGIFPNFRISRGRMEKCEREKWTHASGINALTTKNTVRINKALTKGNLLMSHIMQSNEENVKGSKGDRGKRTFLYQRESDRRRRITPGGNKTWGTTQTPQQTVDMCSLVKLNETLGDTGLSDINQLTIPLS